jgi:hypothetical protein
MEELFWKEVMDAYTMVSVNHEREVKVARNGKAAKIAYDPGSDSIVIVIVNVDTEVKDPLPVPPPGTGRGRR